MRFHNDLGLPNNDAKSGCCQGVGFAQCQIVVDERDSHAAFADAAGDSLDRTVADIAGTKDAGEVGFERKWFAIQRPCG